jgi:hypothetical protein
MYLDTVLRIRIRDPVLFLPPDPGSGIGFWVKCSIILLIGPNFFTSSKIYKINFNFVIFVATIKGRPTNLFSPLSFVAIFGSGMEKNQYPKHCLDMEN